jgi:hypothetical protein
MAARRDGKSGDILELKPLSTTPSPAEERQRAAKKGREQNRNNLSGAEIMTRQSNKEHLTGTGCHELA